MSERNTRGQLLCGHPARYGGLSMVRKYSNSNMGMMWQCNNPVKHDGDKCWRHQEAPND